MSFFKQLFCRHEGKLKHVLDVYELQQEGIDIPEWHKEKWPNEKFE